MRGSFLVASVAATYVTQTSGSQFFFTQCACSGGSIPSSDASLSSLAPSDSDVFGCGPLDDNDFPLASGVQVNEASASGAQSMDFTASSDIFNDGTSTKDWYGYMQLQLPETIGSGTSTLLDITNDAGEDIILSIIEASAEVQISFQANQVSPNQIISVSPGQILEIYFGRFSNGDQTQIFLTINGVSELERSINDLDGTVTTPYEGKLMSITDPDQFLYGCILKEFELSSFTSGGSIDDLTTSITPVPVLPTLDSSAGGFVMDEDTVADFDLNNLLENPPDGIEFSLQGNVPAGLSLDTDTVTLTPAQDFNGDVGFSFELGFSQPAACFRPISSEITVNAVNDAPVLVLAPQSNTLFGSETITFENLQVATDVDFANGALNGGRLVLQGDLEGELFTDLGCSNQGEVIDIDNGVVNFCYKAPEQFPEEASVTLSFQVEDDENQAAANQAVFEFSGRSKLSLPDESPVLFVSEVSSTQDQDISFNGEGVASLGDNDFTNDKDFSVLITSSVDAKYGTLESSSGGSVVGEVFASDVEIIFKATPGFYSAVPRNSISDLDPTSSVDGVGNPIGDCTAAERDSDGFCSIEFTYRLQTFLANGDLDAETPVNVARIRIEAVDGANPVISSESDEIVVNPNEVTNNQMRASITSVEISSDGDSNIFPIEAEITTLRGPLFRASEIDGVLIDQTSQDDGDGCLTSSCTSATISGVPSKVQEAIAALEFFLPEDIDPAENPVVTIDVRVRNSNSGGDSLILDFVIEEAEPPNFFDDMNNVYIVAGAGGGGALVIIVSAIYFSSRAGRVSEEKLLHLAEDAVKLEKEAMLKERGQTGEDEYDEEAFDEEEDEIAKRKLANKRSLKVDADDEIFDWEKHVAKDTGEVYFFNPKTGESRWEPPTVKKYNV